MLKANDVMESFDKNDVDTMKTYPKNFIIPLCPYMIDVAVEEGRTDMARTLGNYFGCRASTYAIQMAIINGHNSLAFREMERGARNNSGISIHYDYKAKKWSDVIPPSYRYDV